MFNINITPTKQASQLPRYVLPHADIIIQQLTKYILNIMWIIGLLKSRPNINILYLHSRTMFHPIHVSDIEKNWLQQNIHHMLIRIYMFWHVRVDIG